MSTTVLWLHQVTADQVRFEVSCYLKFGARTTLVDCLLAGM